MVVAVNRFKDDTTAEIDLVRKLANAAGAEDAVMSNHWAEGGAGAVELANAVVAACKKPSKFKFLYPLEMSIKDKIETIVREMYGGAGVEYSPEAEKKIELYTRQGFDKLPDLHGQDAPERQPRSEPEGRAQRVHRAGARYSRQRRRGIPLSAAGNHGDDARVVDAAGILRYRPGH